MTRALRIIGASLIAVVALAIGLVVLVFVVLAIPPLRAIIVDQGVAYANTVMGGYTLKVKAIDRLDPWGLNARGIQMFDDQQREMVNVPWVLVRLSPLGLIDKTLVLTRVEIDGVKVHLYPTEMGPPEPEEPPSEPSTFTYRAEQLRVRSASLDMELGNRAFHAVIGTLRAGGQYGPQIKLALQEARIRVDEGKTTLLRLHTTKGDWTSERGGTMGLAAQVVGASLQVDADVKPLDEVSPWPVRTASVRLDGLTRRGLEQIGVADGAELNVPVSLALDAKSSGKRLDADAKLRAGGRGGLHLKASADDQAYDLTVDVQRSSLLAIAGILPDMTVEGSLHAHASPTEGTPEKVELRWRKILIDSASVPDGIVRVALPLPVIRLNELTLAGMEDALVVSGEYDTERARGEGHLALKDFKLHDIAYLAQIGLAGALNGDVDAKFSPSTVDANGKLMLVEFRHPSAQLASLDLSLSLQGKTTSPEGAFQLHIDRLVAGELKLDQVSAEADATVDKLTGRLEIRGPTTLLKAEIGGMRTHEGDLRVQAIGRGNVEKHDLRFDLRELLYGRGGISVQELSLYSGKQQVRVGGRLDSDDEVDATIKLAGIDLTEWATLGGIEDVTGKVDGDIRIGGTTSLPRVDATINLANARYKAELPLNAKLVLKGDLAERRAETSLSAYSNTEFGARLTAAVSLPKKPPEIADAISRAKVKLALNAWMPVEQISALVGDQLAGLGGMLEANVKAEGTLDDPDVEADVTAALKLPEQEGEPVEGIRVTTTIDKAQGKVSLWTKDQAGEFLKADGSIDWPGGSPRATLDHPESIQNARFQVKADLQSRRLDAIQGVFAYFSKLYALELPIRAAGSVSLSGDQAKLDGALRMHVVVYGDKLDGRCRLGAESAIDVEAKLLHDQAEVDLKVNTDGGGVIAGKVATKLALDAKEGEPMIGPAKVTLEGKEIAIHKLPGLCNLAGGDADFTLTASGLGNQKPKLDLKGALMDLHAEEMMPIAIDLTARAGDKDAAVDLKIKDDKSGEMGVIAASVPLTYPDGATPTVLPDAPIDARVQFTKLPLANVLSFTQALGRTSGTATADIRVTGKLNDPNPVGYLELADVNLSIASIAQPLRDIEGRLEVKGRSLGIKKLIVRDRRGKIDMEGFVTLHRDLTGEGGLYLEADQFPLRQQGRVIGELTTRARLDVKIPESLQADAQLKILDGRMWLTGETGKNVQPLDPHPDVRFADEKVEHESTPTEEKAEGQGLALGSLTMKTDHELWLMHKDFSIQVGLDLKLAQGEDGPVLEGEASLVRGELALLGKPFKLQRGAIRFAGPMPPDPELEIKAIYSPPAGQDLIVEVSGRGSAPVLEFSGAASNAGEAIMVLQGRSPTTGSKSSAESEASSSMAGIAADMTAGLLIMSARREFGDWVPMISVDTGAQGQPTSARAGFDASKLIPPWASGFAKSAYVEGIVGQSGGSGRVGLGVRLEVGLPRDFLTILGYGPNPGGWSTDVAWSP